MTPTTIYIYMCVAEHKLFSIFFYADRRYCENLYYLCKLSEWLRCELSTCGLYRRFVVSVEGHYGCLAVSVEGWQGRLTDNMRETFNY